MRLEARTSGSGLQGRHAVWLLHLVLLGKEPVVTLEEQNLQEVFADSKYCRGVVVTRRVWFLAACSGEFFSEHETETIVTYCI